MATIIVSKEDCEGSCYGPARKATLYFAAIILAFYAFLCLGRNFAWQYDMAIWSDAAEKSSKKARVYNNLGLAYAREGEFEKAKKEYAVALRLSPYYWNTYGNLGFLYFVEGKLDNAVEQFKIVISINPSHAGAYNNLGVIYDRQGKPEQAMEMFQAALNISSDDARTLYNVGRMYRKKGARDEARRAFEMALKINPDYAEARKELEAFDSRSR